GQRTKGRTGQASLALQARSEQRGIASGLACRENGRGSPLENHSHWAVLGEARIQRPRWLGVVPAHGTCPAGDERARDLSHIRGRGRLLRAVRKREAPRQRRRSRKA